MPAPVEAEAAKAHDWVSNSMSAIEALNAEWYNLDTGLWDAAWWNSANVLTTLADFTTLRLHEANELNIGGYIYNTFVQAQKTHVETTKALAATGMVESMDCLNDDPECTDLASNFLKRRGFDDFINHFYDDEGWWALGLIRSYDVIGDPQLLDAAVRIFEDMQTGLGGPCNGGIYWNKDRSYVNAIANELYLSVAASLANRIPDEKYLDIAKNQWTWFKNSGMINKNNLINDGLDKNCKNNGMQTWSYNQGVILGGLKELFIATGDTRLLQEAHIIAKAAIKALSNENGVLVETDKCELRAGNCGRDGQQFKGIFVRNLRYLHDIAPDPEFKDTILRNANAIWANNRNDRNMLGIAWNGPYIKATGASHSSALDVIVAAVSVSPPIPEGLGSFVER
ncbi:hypothetical protein ACO1O0_002950 [Amphichorda felina]